MPIPEDGYYYPEKHWKDSNCGDPAKPDGPAWEAVAKFARSEGYWLANYQTAWTWATENN